MSPFFAPQTETHYIQSEFALSSCHLERNEKGTAEIKVKHRQVNGNQLHQLFIVFSGQEVTYQVVLD